MKKYRIKKDVQIYHPMPPVILKKGCIIEANRIPILAEGRLILTDDEKIAEYIEEI